MERMICEQCGEVWHVEAVMKDGWRLRESPAPWAYGWLISADRPCCPFDGGTLTYMEEAVVVEHVAVVSYSTMKSLHE